MSSRAVDISFIYTPNDLSGSVALSNIVTMPWFGVLFMFTTNKKPLIIKLNGKLDEATECFFIPFY
jgi:hypothetical protein